VKFNEVVYQLPVLCCYNLSLYELSP
jgi:hypothetical protein